MGTIEKMEREKNIESDLGLKEELSYFIGNLIQMEMHLCMTVAQTENKKILPIISEIRQLRAKYMKNYIGKKELFGHLWCFLKHSLGDAFHLTEIAEKNISLGNDDNAIENLQDSKDLFELSLLVVEEFGKNGNDG